MPSSCSLGSNWPQQVKPLNRIAVLSQISSARNLSFPSKPNGRMLDASNHADSAIRLQADLVLGPFSLGLSVRGLILLGSRLPFIIIPPHKSPHHCGTFTHFPGFPWVSHNSSKPALLGKKLGNDQTLESGKLPSGCKSLDFPSSTHTLISPH